MSIKSATDDLSLRASHEEPIRSSNAGMNFALILTLVFSLAIVIFAVAFAPSIIRSTTENAKSDTSHVTQGADKKVSSNNDKTFVDGTAVQGDAIMGSSSTKPN
jgi:hypothetical protein